MSKAIDKADVADMSIDDLQRALAAKKGAVAIEDFSDAKAAAEKAGFVTTVQLAFNGGSPALRIDY